MLTEASSSRRLARASSSLEKDYSGNATTSLGLGYGMNASSTRRKISESTTTNTKTPTEITILRIPVTIGIQNDTQTEITQGLREGETIILKKTTVTSTTKKSTSAPSVTSLLRPQSSSKTGSMSQPHP